MVIFHTQRVQNYASTIFFKLSKDHEWYLIHVNPSLVFFYISKSISIVLENVKKCPRNSVGLQLQFII